MADGRIVTEYTHSDLDPGDRRHYRVAARNAPGAAGLSEARPSPTRPPFTPAPRTPRPR